MNFKETLEEYTEIIKGGRTFQDIWDHQQKKIDELLRDQQEKIDIISDLSIGLRRQDKEDLTLKNKCEKTSK